MARRILWASLVLAPVAVVARFGLGLGETTLFVLAAAALVPLAWLIGESTEHAAEHTGPGIGGFLNASFGNAPEVIIALFALADGLTSVVRGSITGSIVSNILLVLGFAVIVGPPSDIDRRSIMGQLGLVAAAVLLFLIPAVPGFHGDPDRRSLAWLTLPVAIALVLVYAGVTVRNLRRHSRAHAESGHEPAEGGWSLPLSLATLGIATAGTAVVSEILVHSLEAFAHAAHLSEFFIATVIVAIVGNAAEHGGAIVIASRGKMRLATEIAVSSSAQVALFVAGIVALISWALTPLPLSFRPIELATMGGAAALVCVAAWDGRTRRWEGGMLIAMYVGVALAYLLAGDR
ncbi:MAG TPA: calcium/proton exchanger [Gaiellaceae bacterium]